MILLAGIFSSPIEPGAQLFFLIVCILIGVGAGISLMDARKTFAKKKNSDH